MISKFYRTIVLFICIMLSLIEISKESNIRKSQKTKSDDERTEKLKEGNDLKVVLNVKEADIIRDKRNNNFQIRKNIFIPISLI